MPGVPAIYQQMYARRVFTTDEAVATTGLSKAQVVGQFSYLQKERYLDKVRRGVYAIIPLETRPEPAPTDPYLLASKLARPYLLSYHTGLELHGVAHSSFYKVFVATPDRFQGLTYQGMEYQAVHASTTEIDKAAIRMTVDDQELQVASREWTVAHCALRPRYAGGVEELLQSVRGFSYLDPGKLYDAAKTLGQKVLMNRLGLILDSFRDRWDISPKDLEPFRSAMSHDSGYFGTGPGKTRHVNEWRVIIPADLYPMVAHG